MPSLLRTRSILVGLLMLSISASADVAPDPGYTNVSSDLIIETTSDLSGYRFFLESLANVEEVTLNIGSPTVISAAGRAGVGKYAKLIAVPVSDMNAISGDLSGGLLEGLIRSKRFPNARELLSHNFQTTIPVVEKPVWKAPVYRLSLENRVVTATKTSESVGRSLLVYAIPVVIVGVLIAVGIAIIGLWLFRRSRKKV